ncbi:MAG: thymidine kinase [Candidatus Diapherotrites archaeon]|uniref:Thymidine kinase n=1 Tax=Candidatus Iainarchaeum sp. TaxID=3101447 RepID=A0A497JHM6_9ARCH|nr:thymidine kinase [Candidatus Diapherotrites archaeon]RLG70304.1 MAG: thymidine kinase [Candidatus Diapherotrites archaeon]
MPIEMITGPMFSGKSEELIRRIRRAMIAGQKVQVFTPALDFRGGENCIYSHDKRIIDAIPINKSREILEKLEPNTEVIGVDEIQFLDDEIIDVALELASRNIRVILACLNLDFRGEPFPFRDSRRTVADMIALSDHVDKLHAICTYKLKDKNGKERICGKEAYFTQRLIDGKPAPYDSPLIIVGSEELYEARCREHHIVPGKPKKTLC